MIPQDLFDQVWDICESWIGEYISAREESEWDLPAPIPDEPPELKKLLNKATIKKLKEYVKESAEFMLPASNRQDWVKEILIKEYFRSGSYLI